MAKVAFFKKVDLSLLQVGSLIHQEGHSYPSQIMIHGDNYVLRSTKSHCILRSPSAKRVSSEEPYISEETFVELTRSFREVPDDMEPFTMDNKFVNEAEQR